MADVLSAEEVAALRSALRPPRTHLLDEESDSLVIGREAILPYAAAKVDDALVRAVAAMHDRCARQFAAEFSSIVRRAARVRALPLCQSSYREFAARLANPTCFNLLSPAPLAGPWILEISPAVLFPAIDCMLGGGHRAATIVERPMTDIELRLAGRITALLVHHLRAAWQDAVDLELAVDHVACSPHAPGTVGPDEAVIWTRFEVELCGTRGLLKLAIPAFSLEPLAGQLSGQHGAKASTAADAAATAASDAPATPAPVQLVACLARSTISPDDARQLAAGDLIATEQPAGAPVDVLGEDGVVRFRGRAGAVDGRKALAIDEFVASPDAGAAPRTEAATDEA